MGARLVVVTGLLAESEGLLGSVVLAPVAQRGELGRGGLRLAEVVDRGEHVQDRLRRQARDGGRPDVLDGACQPRSEAGAQVRRLLLEQRRPPQRLRALDGAHREKEGRVLKVNSREPGRSGCGSPVNVPAPTDQPSGCSARNDVSAMPASANQPRMLGVRSGAWVDRVQTTVAPGAQRMGTA